MAFVNSSIPINVTTTSSSSSFIARNVEKKSSLFGVTTSVSKRCHFNFHNLNNKSLVPTMEVAVGSDLISFSLPTNGGGTLTNDDIKQGPTVLYFYPRDNTPGCTVEAQDFRDLMPQLKEMGVSVVGVSKDSVESHDKFVEDLNIPFPLISDDGTLSEGFGVWKLRTFPVERMGIERSTFIIKDGKIVKEWRGVKSGGHVANVFEALKQL